ncbi:hypothetical protein RRG08_043583 [Elysia crispata]|uniref:Uncharacterized protein n=1 Tax=Elysia crispata TaxID=231223 RepID=A0AAE1A635_9GAST|nr:hypothetical protein RRG08_043583 [Elysia crispata]
MQTNPDCGMHCLCGCSDWWTRGKKFIQDFPLWLEVAISMNLFILTGLAELATTLLSTVIIQMFYSHRIRIFANNGNIGTLD